MTSLTFTTGASGNREATFTASEGDTLQMKMAGSSDKLNFVRLYARIDNSMDWKVIHYEKEAGSNYMVQLNVPDGLQMKVETNGTSVTGGLL